MAILYNTYNGTRRTDGVRVSINPPLAVCGRRLRKKLYRKIKFKYSLAIYKIHSIISLNLNWRNRYVLYHYSTQTKIACI